MRLKCAQLLEDILKEEGACSSLPISFFLLTEVKF
jgi:hypothetical protein